MIKALAYQFVVLAVIVLAWIQEPLGNIPEWLSGYVLQINCVLIANLGGVMYCLRAIYLEKCVRKKWDADWETWYYIRPITSAISGVVAYIFLKAGLIVLEAEQSVGSGNYGFLALSFIAGFNVSNFSQKLEEIAKSTFGIEKSRSSKNNE